MQTWTIFYTITHAQIYLTCRTARCRDVPSVNVFHGLMNQSHCHENLHGAQMYCQSNLLTQDKVQSQAATLTGRSFGLGIDVSSR